MKIRRYYKKGIKYKYTISDEFYQKLILEKGQEVADKIDNADKEIVLQSPEEEISWFNDCCNRVRARPRWYLDNLDWLPTFTVNITDIFPHKISEKENLYK